MRNKIILFSDSIESGKTSTLLHWIKDKINVAGILTPDVYGIRKLYDIQENKYYPFETDVNELTDVEVIGRFIFLKSAFKQAIEILKNGVHQKPDWLIIDEIGKLELENLGLEPALNLILKDYSAFSPETKIIIIVRDYLLDKTIEKYDFKDVEVVKANYFED